MSFTKHTRYDMPFRNLSPKSLYCWKTIFIPIYENLVVLSNKTIFPLLAITEFPCEEIFLLRF